VSAACFVTGGAGFVGRHLLAHLDAIGMDVLAPSRTQLDLLDPEATRSAIAAARPDTVFHLAAAASVARSWAAPRDTLLENLATTVNLLEAVRVEAPEAAVVLASSGEVYGRPERLPVAEHAPLRPQNPYAASKAACDLLGGQYADAHGLAVVRTRAFNQAGPGQSDEYVVGSLTRQVAEAEIAGDVEMVLRTGNVDSRRDFTDVRDVVRAHAAAAALASGAYNVCSGRSVSVAELIDVLRACTRVEIHHEVDPARLRPNDVPEIRGSAERLSAETGWAPALPPERTVADALEAWRVRLVAA
jgi:GDP-4-dehydro-6-deoxy-D-mannose reductase